MRRPPSRVLWRIAPLLFAGFAIITASDAVLAQAPAGDATIQVDLLGTVERVPDLAVVTLGITGDATDKDEALARHSGNVLRILAAIREAGVAAKDIEQQRPLVRPLYETWVEDNQEYQGARTGFRAGTRIVLTLRDIAHAGSVIQSVIRSGATYIRTIEFQLTEDRKAAARAEARANAISKAERFARRSAQEAGARGVELISAGEPPPPDGAADMAGPAPEPREWGVPLIIEPGVIEVSEQVRVTFRLLR